MRKGMTLLTALAVFSGCGSENGIYTGETAEQSASLSQSSGFAQYDKAFDNECTVTLGKTVSIQGAGAWFEDGCLSVTEGGVYNLSGILADGMIYIDSDDPVRLVLNGISVKNNEGAAVFCEGGALSIEAAAGTENYFADGNYTYKRSFENAEKNRPNAAFFTGGKLEFCGEGSVTVTSAEKNGVFSDDELNISDCELEVFSETTAICSKTKISVDSGHVRVEGANGFESGGRADINGGSVFINAKKLGIYAGGGGAINGTAVIAAPSLGENLSVKSGLLLAFVDDFTAVPTSDYILTDISHLAENTAISAVDKSGRVVISSILPKTAQKVVFSAADSSEISLYAGGTPSGEADLLGIITGGELSDGRRAAAGCSAFNTF